MDQRHRDRQITQMRKGRIPGNITSPKRRSTFTSGWIVSDFTLRETRPGPRGGWGWGLTAHSARRGHLRLEGGWGRLLRREGGEVIYILRGLAPALWEFVPFVTSLRNSMTHTSLSLSILSNRSSCWTQNTILNNTLIQCFWFLSYIKCLMLMGLMSLHPVSWWKLQSFTTADHLLMFWLEQRLSSCKSYYLSRLTTVL